MAARTITLANARALVRRLADLGPDGTTGRYPNADVNAAFNKSWQSFRQLASSAGSQLFLTYQAPGSGMTVGPKTGCTFGSVALPADCAGVFGVDVVIDDRETRSLDPVPWAMCNEYGPNRGEPIGWCLLNMGTPSTTTVTAGEIAIFPAPDKAYTYGIWYLPTWTDLTTDTHVFHDPGLGAIDWAVQDAAISFAEQDADMAQTAQLAIAERARVQAEAITAIQRVNRTGPTGRVDRMRISRGRAKNSGDFWRGRS